MSRNGLNEHVTLSSPSLMHLALAVAINKSKPRELTIEEYLSLLHQAVIPTIVDESPFTHDINLSVFWKKAYEKSETRRLEVLDDLNSIRNAPDFSHHRNRSATPTTRKRKTTVSQPSTTTKHSRPSEVKPLSGLRRDIVDEIQNSSPSASQLLIRAIYSLNSALRADHPDRSQITASFKSLSSGLSASFNHKPPPRESRLPIHARTGEICALFERIYPFALRVMQYAMLGDDDLQPCVGVIDLVASFQTLLGQLHKLALDRFDLRKRNSRGASSSQKRGPGAQKGSAINHMDEKMQADTEHVLDVLTIMFTALDVSKKPQCQLLEGLLSALLDHIGSSLALLVFGGDESTTGDQDGICPPVGLLHVAHLDADDAKGAARVEGPYLISLLRTAVDVAQKRTTTMPKDCIQWFLPGGKAAKNNVQLLVVLKEALQKTLLRGVFGEDDDTFAEGALRRFEEESDESDDEKTRVATVEQHEEEADDWFVGQLWEYLGWDILSCRQMAKG
ncbi:hypothetical protein PV10_05170 [Exophiala mesophila]|uniref:Uncharacterized protein n=1 Tax=Exophiala mesophila TaxID=212818 RepID=A0A0D1Y0M1_EXOME|nr:uncharacterized protein PV10_05170 [Exophiala mesophila]KIV94006.1 hypothetical protein PV10_05170 [Exophiala mesophila]